MPTILNSFEGGTDGVAVSTSNSGGASGNAFDTVNASAGTTVAFDNARAAHGTMSLLINPGTSATSPHVRWSTAMGGAYGTVWARFYVYMTGYPGATGRLFEARSGSSAIAATLRVNTSGTWAIGGASGASNTSSGTIPLNQWVRFEAKVIGSATTGQVVASLYSSMDSTTATETLTSSAALNTTGTINETRFGMLVAATSGDPTIWLDDVAVSSTAALGPAVPTPNTVLNIGTGAGQNYFKLQYARPGDPAIITKTLAELSAGFSESPYYVTTSDGLRGHFEARLDAPTTSGSTTSRAELREVDSSGADVSWNPLTGEHIMQGTTTITSLPPVKPEVVVAQVFGDTATADIVSIRTQLVSGTIRLRVRINGTSIVSPQIASPYTTGTEFTWKIRFTGGGNVEIYWVVGSTTLPGTPNLTSAAITETSAYFKAGLYNQSNTAAGDAGTAIGAAEHRLLSMSHPGPTVVSSTNTGAGTDTTAVLRASDTTDSAAGTDTAALVQRYPVTDAGSGAEAIDITAIEFKAVTDTATGTDSLFVDFPVLKDAVDSATATDSLIMIPASISTDSGSGSDDAAVNRTSSTADAATAADAVAVLRASAVSDTAASSDAVADVARLSTVTEQGTATEAVAVARFSAVTDTATGTQLVSGGPFTNDLAVGTDEISLVVIPFTQVLPLKLGTVYDVVVVARVPQVNAAPQYLEVDSIVWKSLQYANTLSQPQELSVSCQLSSVTEPVLQRLRDLANLATEIWLYRNGKVVFAGPIQGFQTSGEDLTIKAKGLLAYLRLMVVTTDLRFTAIDQNTIVKSMVDQWQALDYGNFGIDTSAVGTSGQVRDVVYERDELHVIGQRIEDLGKLSMGFDAEVDPATRKLQLWSPTKGVDRSIGEDAIVFDQRNITSGDVLCSVAPGDVASDAFVSGSSSGTDATLYAMASNVELRAHYGRTGVTASYSDVTAQTTLAAYAQGLIDARGDALIVPGPKVRVTPDADLVDYGVGDLVAYELAGALGISGAFRIRKQTINAAPTGQESVDLEFV